METQGHVLRGWSARYYDAGNALFGVPLINRMHLSLIALESGARVLDVGCGTAKVIEALCRRHEGAVEIFGVDPSPEMVAAARRRLSGLAGVSIRLGVGENLPFPDGCFDWVVSCLTTHHLPFPSKRRMLAECHRVLRLGGRLLVSDFGPPRGLWGRLFARIWRDHSHTRDNLEGAVRQIVRTQGFGSLRRHFQGGVIEHLLATKDRLRPHELPIRA